MVEERLLGEEGRWWQQQDGNKGGGAAKEKDQIREYKPFTEPTDPFHIYILRSAIYRIDTK